MPTTSRAKPPSLNAVFTTMKKVLSRHAPPFKIKTGGVPGKRGLGLVVPRPVAIPGAYGGKPTELAMAGIIHQKGYVGFYFTPVYAYPPLAKKLSPALVKCLKGKSCFYIKKLDDGLVEDIEGALRIGTEFFKDRGWL